MLCAYLAIVKHNDKGLEISVVWSHVIIDEVLYVSIVLFTALPFHSYDIRQVCPYAKFTKYFVHVWAK